MVVSTVGRRLTPGKPFACFSKALKSLGKLFLRTARSWLATALLELPAAATGAWVITANLQALASWQCRQTRYF
jgi:hypothetical protein